MILDSRKCSSFFALIFLFRFRSVPIYPFSTKCRYILLPKPCSYSGPHRIFRTYCMCHCDHLPVFCCPGLLSLFPDPTHTRTVLPSPVFFWPLPSCHQSLLLPEFLWRYLLRVPRFSMQ